MKKALSLKQPFAELVISGRKKIELRKWNTKFRGEFFVHASKNPDKEAMKRFGFNELPLGKIVGRVDLVDVKYYSDQKEFDEDHKLHMSNNTFGKYGFVLKDAKRVKPFKCKGRLGFWNLKQK